jgi:serine/threonine protein kinase
MATGYLFRPPRGASLTQYPVTLSHLLTNANRASDVPDLDERFEIAKALVSTVFEFHNIGWMHKNLQSKNILFWPDDGLRGRPNLKKPYLLGFDISRPNQPGEESEKPISSAEDDVYRHPSYRGPEPQPFKPPYDIYSLGVLLFEIGMWRIVNHKRRRGSSRKGSSSHDTQLIQEGVTDPAGDLGRFVGANYRDAVLACLNLDFDRVWDNSDESQRMHNFQTEVQNKIVDPIASCMA